LWHAYVTQLAYVATLHWLHTLFAFLFGVLQFMLANPLVLKRSANEHNLYYFVLLMAATALTGAGAYLNTFFQHKRNRTVMHFTDPESRIHEEQQRRVRASLQCADRGRAGVAVDRGAGGDAGGERQGTSGDDDGSGGTAVRAAAGGGDRG